jgi:transposase
MGVLITANSKTCSPYWSGGNVRPAVAVSTDPGASRHHRYEKGNQRLSVLVEQEMELDPFEDGAVFLFCNRQRRIMKALFWDATGFCLVQKRLEKHRFPWPQTTEQVREITDQQLEMLLSGIDFWHAHKRIEYRSVS